MTTASAETHTDPAETAKADTTETKAAETKTAETKTETAAAETKAADTKTSPAVADVTVEGQTPAGAAPAASKVPAAYTLTVPEGDAAYIDAYQLQYLKDVAKASGWANEDAQAAVNEHIVLEKATRARWLETTKADPTYGGATLAQTELLAKQAIDRIRPVGHARRESFQQLLHGSGLLNHIEVASFLADLGKLMAEDRPGLTASAGGQPPASAAEALYGAP